MKKNLLFSALYLFTTISLFSQSDGDLRVRSNNAGYGTATTFSKYVSASDSWIISDVIPTATTNVIIRDGYIQTSNGTGYVAGTLTIGEGGAAKAVATVSGGVVTGITITDPGKLNVVPGVTFIGAATTLATATVTSAIVTAVSYNDKGSGYTNATVTFSAPASGTTATGTAVISGGRVTGITITDPGSGYTTLPTITITGDGTGASYTAQVGIQSINITNGGAGYTTAPTILLGTAFQAGNSGTARSITVSGDVTFKSGASLLTGGGSGSITSTLVIGGNLIAASPVSFITQVPTSVSSTTVSFTKAGTATITGPSFAFRNISLGAGTIVIPSTDLNVAGSITTPINPTGGIDASNITVNLNTYAGAVVTNTLDSAFLNGVVKNLTMNKTDGVVLNQTIAITGLWSQQAGILTLRPGNLVTIPSPAAITGPYSSSNYIATDTSRVTGLIGALRIQNITSSTVFPVGQGGNYLPVTVAPSNASTFTASVFTGATDDGTPGGTATADKTKLVDAIYNVTRTTGTGNATLTVGFPPALKGSGFASINNNQLGIAHYNGTSWDAVTGNGDNTQNTASAIFNSFSPFRVEVNLAPIALPVKLGDITAAKSNGQVQVKWNVYTETNIDKYIVERSTDGINFIAVGVVPAQGKSVYSFSDNTALTGKNLYRIKAVEKDNSFALTRIALVDLTGGDAMALISPNPVTEGYFTIALSNFKAGKVGVKLYSNVGQLIADKLVDYNGSYDTQLIYLPSSIAKGNYHVVITDGAVRKSASVIIK